jgi:hypothetical protein
MSLERLSEGILITLPIIFLLIVGAVITLRSGVHDLSTGRGYVQVAGNLSHMMLRVVGYVAIFLAVQHMIGLRPSLGW